MKHHLTAALGIILVGVTCLSAELALKTADAQDKLKAGALLVDVRTAEEYQSKHLPGAVNIPVDNIKSGITNHSPDKSRVILLHCQSGGRSSRAQPMLRALGYTNAFNIGSYKQAEAVATATTGSKTK